MRIRSGFSLIETLIVVAIISVIATIAIPILLSARRNSLDEKARQSIRNVLSAQAAYYAKEGQFGELDDLATAVPPYLDARFNAGSADMGNDMTVSIVVSAGGEQFSATVDNPGGNHDYAGDDTGLITELP